MGCHFLLQGIFPTQGLNSGIPQCRQILYQLRHQGSPLGKVKWVERVWTRTESLGCKREECFGPSERFWRCCINIIQGTPPLEDTCVQHWSIWKTTFSKQQLYFLKTRHLLLEVTCPAVQGQPADATAVSTPTPRWPGPVGAAGLRRAPLWVESVALSSWRQSVSSLYWAPVPRAAGWPGTDARTPGASREEVRYLPSKSMIRPLPSQTERSFSPPSLFWSHFTTSLQHPGVSVNLQYFCITCLLFRLLLPVLATHWNLSPEVNTHFQLVNVCPLHFQGRVWELSLRKEKKKEKKKTRKWEPHAKGKSEQIAVKLNCLFVWIKCYKFLSIMFDSKLSSKQQTHYKNAKGI